MAGDGGAAAFKAKLKLAVPTIEAKINTLYRELGRKMFTDLVTNSPQWSGNLASNWHIGQGNYAPVTGYDSVNWHRDDPHQMGQNPAVASTLLWEIPKLEAITYKMPIVFSNPTPYAMDVEMSQGPNGRPIRPENIHAQYGAVAMLGYIDTKYKALKAGMKT